MKKCLYMFAALLLFAGAAFAFDSEARLIVQAEKICGFEAKATRGGRASVGDVKVSGRRVSLVDYYYKNKSEDWETAGFKFKADFDGSVLLFISALRRSHGGKTEMLTVAYDDIAIDGKPVLNGDFSGDYNNWWGSRTFPTAILSETAADGKQNKFLRAWCNSYLVQRIPVAKGVEYEITFRTKPLGKIDIDRGECLPLDISKYSNFNLSDFSIWKFPYNLSEIGKANGNFGGIKFDLIKRPDGKGFGGVLFASKNNANAAKKITVDRKIAGKFIYILHTSVRSSKSEPPTAKVNMKLYDGTEASYTLRRYRDTWFFDDSGEINNNARPVFYAKPDKKLGAVYLSRIDMPDGAALKSLEIETERGDAFLLLGITVGDKQVAKFNIEPFDKKEWVAVDIPEDIYVREGSALDQSRFFDSAPAGTYGRVILSERGTLAFEKTPEKDVRFKGFSEYSLSHFLKFPQEKRTEEIKRYAKSFKTHGYNFARISFEILRDDMSDIEREALYDTADRLLYELKKNGVYVHLTLTWYKMGLKDYDFHIRDDVKLRAVFGEPKVRAQWAKNATYVLNHFNPYTGMRWKDDPMFVCAEYYNELAICYSRMDESRKFHPSDKILPETRAFVMDKWRGWLEKRYKGDISALNAAWDKIFSKKGKFAYKSFAEVPCIVAGNDDWERCCWDFMADFVAFAEKTVDATGYKGLKVQNNLGPNVYGTYIRSKTTDYVIANTYFAHPSSFDINNASCYQGNPLQSGAGYWRGIAAMKINNRPFFVTEYNHCYWNTFRYVMPAMFAPLSAFQNFSGLTIHSDAVPYAQRWSRTMGAFKVYPSPVAQANELVSSAAFIRGDVQPARHRIDIAVSDDFLQNNTRSVRAFNSSQTQYMLLTGFGAAFGGDVPKAVKGVKFRPADMTLSPVGSSEIVSEAWYHSVKDGGGAFDLEKFVSTMREKGILPPDNITDVKRGILQSDTGEITVDMKKCSMKVSTPRTEIAAMQSPTETRLGALKIVSADVPSSIGVVSLDGAKISDSSRLMFMFITREGNTDMALSYDKTASAYGGRIPMVMKKGTVRAELRLDPRSRYEVYPVALNGERRAKIPFEFSGGVMKIAIDNSKLPNGATPFFEIVKVK